LYRSFRSIFPDGQTPVVNARPNNRIYLYSVTGSGGSHRRRRLVGQRKAFISIHKVLTLRIITEKALGVITAKHKKMDEPDVAEGLTQEAIDEYREAFGMFDINGDGA
jgi:hypothetical protein